MYVESSLGVLKAIEFKLKKNVVNDSTDVGNVTNVNRLRIIINITLFSRGGHLSLPISSSPPVLFKCGMLIGSASSKG